jgi:AcrR family transcriptional regulator
MQTSSRREHLIDTAIELFGEHGFHATGIDTILEKAGVSKKTLYHHFRSKDELILAALRKYDGLFRNNFMRQVEALADSPRDRLLAIFDVGEQWFQQNNFYGCMFINAIGEYSQSDSAIRDVCREFKGLVRSYIQSICEKAGARDPAALAEELALLFEGAIVTAQISLDNSRAARVAKTAATALIEQALKPNPDN